MPVELELWKNSDHVLLRDPTTGQTHRLAGVVSVTFSDGTTFPPTEERDVAALHKDGRLTAESKTLKTLSGETVTAQTSRLTS